MKTVVYAAEFTGAYLMNPWKGHQRRSLVEAPLLVVGLAALFWLAAYRGDVTRFFHLGEVGPTPPELASAFVYPGQDGYDGQYYLALGLDPLLSRQASVAALDNPLYRSRRILYPASGFFLAAGHPHLLPFVLIGLNLAAFISLVWTAEGLWSRPSSHSSEGLLTLCLTGAWISLLFATAELVEVALLAGAMLAYRRARYGLAGC